MASAGAGEIWVTGLVRDLVYGSGIAFEARGTQPLKGVPGEWTLWQARSNLSPDHAAAASGPGVNSARRRVDRPDH